jgi:DNA invertase Pin-like site-specific DNA recombinase
MQLDVALVRTRAPFAYQAIAARAAILNQLGMTASAIARVFGVTDKTVTKAIRWGAPPQTPPP